MRIVIEGLGVGNPVRSTLSAAVSSALGGRADHEDLTVVLTRLHNGAWTVFIIDGANLEVVDAALTARVMSALADVERQMAIPLGGDDRRVLAAIGRAHGHGPRRPLALLDIAWGELGSEPAARAALQRLLLLGYVELTAGPGGRELLGRLTVKGAEAVGYA